jgi:hypothetical protein
VGRVFLSTGDCGLPTAVSPSRILFSGIVYPDADRLRLAAQSGGTDERRTSRVVVVLDLAIEALKALGRNDLARRLDRPHRTSAFAQVAGTAAFGTTREQIEKVQPIE